MFLFNALILIKITLEILRSFHGWSIRIRWNRRDFSNVIVLASTKMPRECPQTGESCASFLREHENHLVGVTTWRILPMCTWVRVCNVRTTVLANQYSTYIRVVQPEPVPCYCLIIIEFHLFRQDSGHPLTGAVCELLVYLIPTSRRPVHAFWVTVSYQLLGTEHAFFANCPLKTLSFSDSAAFFHGQQVLLSVALLLTTCTCVSSN